VLIHLVKNSAAALKLEINVYVQIYKQEYTHAQRYVYFVHMCIHFQSNRITSNAHIQLVNHGQHVFQRNTSHLLLLKTLQVIICS